MLLLCLSKHCALVKPVPTEELFSAHSLSALILDRLQLQGGIAPAGHHKAILAAGYFARRTAESWDDLCPVYLQAFFVIHRLRYRPRGKPAHQIVQLPAGRPQSILPSSLVSMEA